MATDYTNYILYDVVLVFKIMSNIDYLFHKRCLILFLNVIYLSFLERKCATGILQNQQSWASFYTYSKTVIKVNTSRLLCLLHLHGTVSFASFVIQHRTFFKCVEVNSGSDVTPAEHNGYCSLITFCKSKFHNSRLFYC